MLRGHWSIYFVMVDRDRVCARVCWKENWNHFSIPIRVLGRRVSAEKALQGRSALMVGFRVRAGSVPGNGYVVLFGAIKPTQWLCVCV